jgi:hypothetical protein
LHSSILPFAMQHKCPVNAAGLSRDDAKRPPETSGPNAFGKFRWPIRQRPCAADRARRNRGSPPPGDR